MRKQLTLPELLKRTERRERVEHAEIAALLGGTAQEQQAASRALYLSELRGSVIHLTTLAKAESYANQETIDLVQQLSITAEFDVPFLNMLKDMGLWAIEHGRFEDGLNFLQSATNQGWVTSSNKSDAYHQQLMKYMHDPQVDGALATIAHGFPQPIFMHEIREKRRVLLFASTVIGESSPTIVTVSILQDLHARGYDVILVTSEFWCGSLSSICQSLIDQGIHVECAPHVGPLEKIAALLGIFQRLQPDVILYMITPMDFVAKIISEVGAAPAQCMLNMAFEHHCGKFDYVLQSTSPAQEQTTAWPGKSKYIGSFAALESRIIEAVPLERSAFNVGEDSVVLVTHGRISKCSNEYITAVGRILAMNPSAVLVLAGPCGEIDVARLNTALAEFTLGPRIVLMGPVFEHVPALLKACDIYLDPFPWPGGQSTLEAMWAGLPIVAMQGVRYSAEDPDSYGPIGTATTAFLPPGYERANPGDLDAYVKIASNYIADTKLRRADGTRLRARVVSDYRFELFMNRLDHYLTLSIDAHASAKSAAFAGAL